jgi:DNA-3-methyladenine glycosylase II
MNRIDTLSDLQRGLVALRAGDRRLEGVIEAAGQVPLRRLEPGFASLCSIIVSQQVSRASAEAIHDRLRLLVDPLTPQTVLAHGAGRLTSAGLSRPKQKTLLALAARIVDDGLDLDRICAAPADEAMAELVSIPGIGPWTAEIYLLFCAGHPDIFPARDLALQVAVGQALGLDERPDHRETARIAESWAPWRGVAARLFWAYYRQIRGREAAPAPEATQKNE